MKPVPVAIDGDVPYWSGAAEHKLVLQACSGCDLLSSQPRVVCPRCHSESFHWKTVSGLGDIHSFTIVRQATIDGFQDDVPYVVVHVQITEEPTCYITANLVIDRDHYDDIDIGLPVAVCFEQRGDAVLPQFRLV